MTATSNLSPVSSFLKIARQYMTWLGLAYWVWMVIDLVLHPLAAGPNEGGPLFRWLSALMGTLTILTALYIIRRVPENQIGLLLFWYGVGATGWSLRSEWADMRLGTLANLSFSFVFFLAACPAAVLMLFCYPDGTPYPLRIKRWMPFITGALVVCGLFYIVGFVPPEGSPVKFDNPLLITALAGIGTGIFIIGFVLGMSFALVTLVLRYRAGSERLRLQLRWMVWLLGVAIVLAIIPFRALPGPIGRVVGISMTIVGFLFWQLFPALGIGIAVLRHNLWDIDILIRRTLVYTLLSALLGLVYYGSVVVLQSVLTADGGRLTAVGGQPSAVVIVVTTLAIAALFNPLRKRIQDFIDRRFYRRKYDSEKALAQFAAAARNEVDIARLKEALINVVEGTMQPEQVGLWLKPTDSAKWEKAYGGHPATIASRTGKQI